MWRTCTQKFLQNKRILLPTRRLLQLTSIGKPIRLLEGDGSPVYPWWVLIRQSSTAAATAAADGNEEEAYNVSLRDIALSFKEWFSDRRLRPRTWRNEQLRRDVNRICEVLSQGVQHVKTDEALTQLNVNLTEECVVKVLKLQNDVAHGLNFFDWAGRQRGYQHTRVSYYTILKMLSQAKLTGALLNWLESFQKQKPILGLRFYDTLIMGYALAGKADMALQVFARMRFQGLDLDRFAYNMLLNRLVEEDCFDVVDTIYKQILQAGIEDSNTYGILIKNLCKQGKLDEAKQLLNELKRKAGTVNESALEIVISALCKDKKMKEACTLIEEFRKEGKIPMSKVYDAWIGAMVEDKKVDDALEFFQKRTLEGYVPGPQCYNALASGLLRKHRLEELFDLLIEMREKHIFPDQSTMNATVCFFCKGGLVEVAFDLFNEKSEMGFKPHYMTYNELINALCIAEKVDDAYRVLEDGLARGFFPGKLTYFILANALWKAQRLDKMCELIDASIDRHRAPGVAVCRKFISALCRAGRVDDAYLLPSKIRRNNMSVDERVYRTLIYDLCDAKKRERWPQIYC